MATILSIETATPVCSIALHRDGFLLANQDLFIEKSHSVYLNQSIDHLVKSCSLAMKDIQAIALSMGPGSYTGLRIGTSTAKGFCYALDIPLIAVNTLEAMAWGVNIYNMSGALLCPMIDARRMEVYCLVMDSACGIIEPTHAKIVDEQSFSALLKNHTFWFFGNGSAKVKGLFSQQAMAVFLDDVYPSAVHVGRIAIDKFNAGDFVDTAYFEPYYLKDFIGKKPSVKNLVK